MSSALPEEKNDRAGAEDAPARGRGRPRSAEAEQAILDATLRMLGTHGVGGTTIEGVAAEACVGVIFTGAIVIVGAVRFLRRKFFQPTLIVGMEP